MNFNKFFEEAKAAGLSESQIQVSSSSSLQVQLFHHEIESYEVDRSQSVIGCGILDGKFGSAALERIDKTTSKALLDRIILSARLNEKEEKADLFKGSPKYKRFNGFNEALAKKPVSEKIALLKQLEDEIYAADKRITDVEISYEESESSSGFYNSHGIKLRQKSNYFVAFVQATARDEKETKNGYSLLLENDFSAFDIKKIAKEVLDKVLPKFGADSLPSKKYPTIISNEVMPSLIMSYISSAIADNVQRHTSLFEGKLGQKIANSKLTIEEKPLTKNIFFTSFDDEGVACQNKAIIKNGVLKTFLYNRETAKKDGVESTGNAVWGAGKISTGASNIFVKPGKVGFNELIAPIQDGVFITEIMGLHAGMNATSGDFSCQAEGYRIRDGKIAEPLTLITLSGNLLKMFQDLKGFDGEAKMSVSGVSVGNAYIKAMNIGGK